MGKYSTFGEQADGSVVDRNGLIITAEERQEINRAVYSLPIYQDTIKDDIMHHLKQGDDIIIDGSTGSGKSTGVPIFVREALGKKVIQTVPRVLAAMTCAERISQILLSQTGNPDYTLGYGEIGYRTGGGSSSNSTSKLSIHTDGLEMMRQLFSEIFPEVLIIDEVQNKSIATDLLLFLSKYKIDIQLIIMSATLDPKLYQTYLETRGRDIPIIKIPGRTFPIEDFYYQGVGAVSKTVELAKSGKHTLHLVSGKSRIEEVIAELQKDLGPGYEIIPLHAELPKEEQFNVIIPSQNEFITRVIVATNVAEESITIPYLNAVVDEGMHKVGRINHEGVGELRVEPITLANTLQRKGRVGRTSPGEYHRFNDTPISDLHEYPEAAIQNSMLMREILLFAKSGKDISGIISRAKTAGKEAFVHEVDQNLLHIGYSRLTQIGALDELGNITQLGEDLLSISLDPTLGRIVIEGILRGCAEETIAIASILSVNGFLSKDGTWRELKEGMNKKSDFFTYLDLFDLVTKKEINQQTLERLVYLGLDRDEVRLFEENTEKALYEVVDLAPLGIKKHRIAQICNKITNIQNSLISSGVNIVKNKIVSGKQISLRTSQSEKDLTDNILISIASGYPFFVFAYDPVSKTFKQFATGGNKISSDFKLASTSSVTPSPSNIYLAEPFIIGPNETQDDVSNDTDFFEENIEKDSDLRILSHVTELNEGLLKGRFETQIRYNSPFKNIRKAKVSESYANIGEVKGKYDALVEEFGNGSFSHIQFLQYALPLFLMTANHSFVKFLNGKPMSVVDSLENRLRKFFIHTQEDYLYRISNNIADIENSYRNDSEIHDAFRVWEQKEVTRSKKQRGKKISRTKDEEIEHTKALFDAKNLLIQAIGSIEGGNFDTKFDEVLKSLSHDFIIDFMSDGRTYNILRERFYEELGGKSVESLQHEIKKTNSISDQKSSTRLLKKKITNCNTSIAKVEALVVYCSEPVKKNFESIDFDFCVTVLDGEKIEETFTKSQRSSYHKGIKNVQTFKYDESNSIRASKNLLVAEKSFKTIIEIFRNQKEKLEEELKELDAKIESEKEGTLETRKEINFFFSSIYEDEYFNTVIKNKISKILTEILEGGNIDDVIERYIVNELDPSKLKKIKRTENLHSFFGLLKKYEAQLKIVQQLISKYNKYGDNNTDVDDIISKSNIIVNRRKEIIDTRSQILTLRKKEKKSQN